MTKVIEGKSEFTPFEHPVVVHPPILCSKWTKKLPEEVGWFWIRFRGEVKVARFNASAYVLIISISGEIESLWTKYLEKEGAEWQKIPAPEK